MRSLCLVAESESSDLFEIVVEKSSEFVSVEQRMFVDFSLSVDLQSNGEALRTASTPVPVPGRSVLVGEVASSPRRQRDVRRDVRRSSRAMRSDPSDFRGDASNDPLREFEKSPLDARRVPDEQNHQEINEEASRSTCQIKRTDSLFQMLETFLRWLESRGAKTDHIQVRHDPTFGYGLFPRSAISERDSLLLSVPSSLFVRPQEEQSDLSGFEQLLSTLLGEETNPYVELLRSLDPVPSWRRAKNDGTIPAGHRTSVEKTSREIPTGEREVP